MHLNRLRPLGTLGIVLGLGLGTYGAGAAVARPADAPAAAPAAHSTDAARSADASAGASADDTVRHVVVVSIDGLSVRAVRLLGEDRAPAMHRMIRNGASTLDARTLHELTTTLPNHATMLTGRRATGPGGHGVLGHRDPGGAIHDVAGEHVSSFFSVVHDAGGSTSLRSSKSKFQLFDRTWGPRRGGPDHSGTDQGVDKIDDFLVDKDRVIVADLVEDLKESPDDASFLHLGMGDVAGHSHGFLSQRHLDTLHRADRLVGRVLDTVREKRSLRRHTVVVLTADHGGAGDTHTSPKRLANYRVPFLVWGAGVARGADLYDLNPQLTVPGDTRPDYDEGPPVRIGDVANLVTDLLDLRRVPGSQFNLEDQLDVIP